MANLFPEDDVELEETEILEDETEDDEPNYQPGLQVNDETNDFVLTGSGKIRECDETESWIQWCKKNLETPRYQCIAYSDDIGIDMEGIMQCKTREERESMLFAEISESLAADPYNRTSYVEKVEFEWEADSVACTVSVIGNDGSRAEIEVELQN